MGAASLPSGAGESGADRLDQAAMRIGGHQSDGGEAAGGQVAEEPQPARAVLGVRLSAGSRIYPVAVGVDPGGGRGRKSACGNRHAEGLGPPPAVPRHRECVAARSSV